jgi:hypothetical protein
MLKETIRRILKEETQLPISLRRRFRGGDQSILNDMKQYAASQMFNYPKLNKKTVVMNTAKSIFWEKIYDFNMEDISNDDAEKYENIVGKYLFNQYGREVLDYISGLYKDEDKDYDGFKYVFHKHTEPYGGSGFSEKFDTWYRLLEKYASWLPVDWSNIKSTLNNMSSGGSLSISKPGDDGNTWGYHFRISKIKKEDF